MKRARRQGLTWAHLPGGGPEGEKCRRCEWFEGDRNAHGKCGKAAEMAGAPLKSLEPLDPTTAACKYWQRARSL